MGQEDMGGIPTGSNKLAKSRSYILACFTCWKETKKANRPCPGTLSKSSEQYGWPAVKIPLLALVFSLGAWNQNKKSTTRFPYIISFNPHTMPVSRASLASFHRGRNRDLELFQDLLKITSARCIKALRFQSPALNLCSQITRSKFIIYLIPTCQEKVIRAYFGNLFEGQFVWRISNTIFLVLFSYGISLICGQTFPRGKIM